MISNTNVKNVYPCDGKTREWPVTFEINENVSSLKVLVADSDGVVNPITTGYFYEGNVLTYPTFESGLKPLEEGKTIIVYRQTPNTQEIDLIQGGVLNPEVLESGYDKLTLQVQELAEQVNRSVKLPITIEEGITERDPIKEIEEAKEEALVEINNALEGVEGKVDEAQEQVILAANQVSLAEEQKSLASEQANLSLGFSEAASESALQAKHSLNVVTEKVNQATVFVEKAEQLINEAKNIPNSVYVAYEVGTPKGTYDGSLRVFPTTASYQGGSSYVWVNGVHKEKDYEYTESPDGGSISFDFDLVVGDRVVIIVAAGFFELKDIERFQALINKHNTDPNSHNDIREALKQGGIETNSVFFIGNFEKNQSITSSKIIDFEEEPIGVSLRFSDMSCKMWLNCTYSTAGFERIDDNKLRVYYSISSDDFTKQNTLKGPFSVQFVIKYKDKTKTVEIATQEEVNAGVNNTKAVSPLTLKNRLENFSGLKSVVIKNASYSERPSSDVINIVTGGSAGLNYNYKFFTVTLSGAFKNNTDLTETFHCSSYNVSFHKNAEGTMTGVSNYVALEDFIRAENFVNYPMTLNITGYY